MILFVLHIITVIVMILTAFGLYHKWNESADSFADRCLDIACNTDDSARAIHAQDKKIQIL